MGLCSCDPRPRSHEGIVFCGADGTDSSSPLVVSSDATVSIEDFIHTRYTYPRSNQGELTIENSLPRGGLTYTAPNGKEYVYALFWTRIINETEDTLRLSLHLPMGVSNLPGPSLVGFRVLLPSESFDTKKVEQFNYGISDIDATLDRLIDQEPSMQRVIAPNMEISFFAVTLFDRRIEGLMRNGLHLDGDSLSYRVNGTDLKCGTLR